LASVKATNKTVDYLKTAMSSWKKNAFQAPGYDMQMTRKDLKGVRALTVKKIVCEN